MGPWQPLDPGELCHCLRLAVMYDQCIGAKNMRHVRQFTPQKLVVINIGWKVENQGEMESNEQKHI